MHKINKMFEQTDPVVIKSGLTGFIAIGLSALGILFPVILLLGLCMLVDYVTGIVSAGYLGKIKSSVGLWGIVKKLMYAVIVAVAMACDWVVINVATQVGIVIPTSTFFGLLVALWLIFNELISILENLIKMEISLPSFLVKLVNKFKTLLDEQGDSTVDKINVKGKTQDVK